MDYHIDPDAEVQIIAGILIGVALGVLCRLAEILAGL